MLCEVGPLTVVVAALDDGGICTARVAVTVQSLKVSVPPFGPGKDQIVTVGVPVVRQPDVSDDEVDEKVRAIVSVIKPVLVECEIVLPYGSRDRTLDVMG
jgi:hypothetical protein